MGDAWNALLDAMAGLLAWLYDLWPVPSYGAAIILLTIVVMGVLTPLTMRGTRSMIKMQQMQPEIKRIQREFADDRQQMNEEMMAFYRENQINPVGGCLPLLAQMPVFIILFQVLRGVTRRADPSMLDLDPAEFNPDHVSESTQFYQDLSKTNEMDWFSMDLSLTPTDALGEGFVTALPFLVMILIVFATGYVQQRQIQGRNPNAEVNPTQQMMQRVMPAFIAVISFTLQGALVLYFVVSNLFRVGQQALITRKLYRDDEGNPIDVRATEKPASGSKGGSKRTGGQGGGPGSSGGKGRTEPKGRATPARDGGSGSGKKASPNKGSGKPGTNKPSRAKGANKRTAASGSLPQPRPRKKKR